MQKCETSCMTRKTCIILMYGSMEAPYKWDNTSNGLRGIRWNYKDGKIFRDDVVWTIDNGFVNIRHIDSTMDQSWNDDILNEAYNHAYNYKFE